MNPEVLKDLTEWHDSLEDRKNHEEEHLEDYVREHKRKGRVFLPCRTRGFWNTDYPR